MTVVEARATRVPIEQDLARLTADHALVFPAGTGLNPAWFDDAAASCDEEATAWSAGDNAAARRLRLEQFQTLQTHLEPLTEWCRVQDERTGELTGKIFARLVAAHLSVESGRDIIGLLFRTPASNPPLTS